MKPSKFFSAVFGILAAVLMVLSIAGTLLLRGHEAQSPVPREAEDAARQFAQALSAGDYQGAGSQIWGQPELGAQGPMTDPQAQAVWDAFRDSLICEGQGPCYWESQALYQDVTVTSLDIAALLNAIPHSGQQPQETVETAISQAPMTQTQGRLQLLEQEGRWFVLPDKTILSAMSGGVR